MAHFNFNVHFSLFLLNLTYWGNKSKIKSILYKSYGTLLSNGLSITNK